MHVDLASQPYGEQGGEPTGSSSSVAGGGGPPTVATGGSSSSSHTDDGYTQRLHDYARYLGIDPVVDV